MVQRSHDPGSAFSPLAQRLAFGITLEYYFKNPKFVFRSGQFFVSWRKIIQPVISDFLHITSVHFNILILD